MRASEKDLLVFLVTDDKSFREFMIFVFFCSMNIFFCYIRDKHCVWSVHTTYQVHMCDVILFVCTYDARNELKLVYLPGQ